jgi:hypothetical protein
LSLSSLENEDRSVRQYTATGTSVGIVGDETVFASPSDPTDIAISRTGLVTVLDFLAMEIVRFDPA